MAMFGGEMIARARVVFLVASVLLLVVGVLLFAFAESVATLPAASRAGNAWPWPIGPLALRFVASLLISGALASYLAARRPDRPTVAAFATVLVIVMGMLLLHFLANLGVIDWSKPAAVLWVAVLIAAFLAAILLVARARRNTIFSVPPLPATPVSARNIALFIFVLTGLVGGTMFFFPGFGRERWPWDLANSTNVQLLGAVFLAVGISSLVSWLHPSWYGYDIFYPAAGTFALVALAASFIHWNLFAAKPLTSWIFVAIYIVGVLMGFYPYLRYAFHRGDHLEPQAV